MNMTKFMSDENAHIFWATIGYHRWWLTIDQIELSRLRQLEGRLTAQAIRRIGAVYYINRGIRQSAGDRGADKLAEKLNGAACPRGLLDQGNTCLEIAEWAANEPIGDGNENTITKGWQVSAITKLMWFLYPEGWTLFDRFAANGLGIPVNIPSRDRAIRFYRVLAEKRFEHLVQATQATVAEFLKPFPNFYIERVLDRYLMIRGGLYGEEQSELPLVLQAYLEGLGSQACGALLSLARRLQCTLGSDPLQVYGVPA